MKGLELKRSYWEHVAAPVFQKSFPERFCCMAVGALGHGSEFLGLDDEFSQDHHWGPGFSVFLTEDDYTQMGEKVYEALLLLPQDYHGYKPFWGAAPGSGRNGVGSFVEWLNRQRILAAIPQTDRDWLDIHEHQLLWATNGVILHDPLGEVSGIRKQLSYYPDPVWRKRLALKCHQLHQSGSYQTSRFLKRNDLVTVDVSLHKFTIHAMQMWFLLRRQYAPIYKWLHTMFKGLPNIHGDVRQAVLQLSSPVPIKDKLRCVKLILESIQDELGVLCPTVSRHESCLVDPDPFAGIQVAQEINASISDREFRDIHYLLQAGAWTDN